MAKGLPIRLAGRDYAIDVTRYERASIETIRQQADTSQEPSEAALNPLDLWRRTQDDWTGGAGQEYFDKRETSQRRMYLSSNCLDPWNRGRLSLANEPALSQEVTRCIKALTADGQLVLAREEGGSYVITVAGAEFTPSELYPTQRTWPGENTFTKPEPPANGTIPIPEEIRDVATDGANLYVLTPVGIYLSDLEGMNATFVHEQSGDAIAYHKGRLLVADGPDLYNIFDFEEEAVKITPPLLNDSWRWTAFTETPASILAAGRSGSRSAIYTIRVQDDGASLSAPVVAAELPVGEYVQSLLGYIGTLLIGTTAGFRLAQEGDGITYGPVVEVGGAVTTMVPEGKFVWFGVNGDDGLSSIGRLDLSYFPRDTAPAYAIDLWGPTTDRESFGPEPWVSEKISDLVIAEGRLTWIIHAERESSNSCYLFYRNNQGYCVEGEYTSSAISYGLSDEKVFEYLSIVCAPLQQGEQIEAYVEVDGVRYTPDSNVIEGVGNTGGELFLGGIVGNEAKVILRIRRGAETNSPEITRVTLRATPRPRRGEQFLVPIILRERVTLFNGVDAIYNPAAEFQFLKNVERAGVPVEYEEWGYKYRVVVDGIHFGPDLEYTSKFDGLQGTCFVQLRRFTGG